MSDSLIKLGKGRGALQISLASLVGSCGLIQGRRGSGKSYLARVIAEQSIAAGLQTILIDPEGEYVTLREKLDILIVGNKGDVPCEVRTAKLMAVRVAELGISTVLDLSHMEREDQQAFLADFASSMLRLPKKLEASRLLIIDEAHEFCPESGKAAKVVSAAPVVSLMSLGRKRGLGAVLVTQRLAKLRNDAASEAANIFIGATSPIDRNRAQDLLGIDATQKRELSKLANGEFFAVGPGLSEVDVTRFQGRRSITTHPEPAERFRVRPPPPRKAVTKLLTELADLPAEAEAEATDLAAAQAEIRTLKHQLQIVRSGAKPSPDAKAIDRAVAAEIAQHARQHRLEVSDLKKKIDTGNKALALVLRETERAKEQLPKLGQQLDRILSLASDVDLTPASPSPAPPVRPPPRRSVETRARAQATSNGKIGGQRRLLLALASAGVPLDRLTLAVVAFLTPGAGTFATYLGRERTAGHIETVDRGFQITSAGLQSLGDWDPIPLGGPELVAIWRPKIGGPGGGMRRIFDALYDAGPEGLDREPLAIAAGLEPSAGTFATYLGRLRKRGVVPDRRWPHRLHPAFFEDP